ncbi:MAG TPA: sigma 54-interacting transcriptional regulator, partial [Kofleriaceae bacterium]|nr:sigma 54-interacting transcriptional regulator [Kofleriaceae bacterium]
DDGSSNGTFVNGERTQHATLALDDIVRMGNTLLEVTLRVPGGVRRDATMIGSAPAFLRVVEAAERVAASTLPILLLGETGSGKDELARHVHARSGRTGAYVAVNCATLPNDLAESALFGHKRGAFTGATMDSEGFFAQAAAGTIFLDEIAELPLHQQPKLLRVLENREYVPVGSSRVLHSDARAIAATHVDLAAAVAAGSFREDLYARLAGAVLRLPPLRQRRADILPLAMRFLADAAPGVAFTVSAHAAEALLLHAWPRNIRELRVTMQRLALEQPAGGEIALRTVVSALGAKPAAATPTPAPAARAQGPGREELLARLVAARGNVQKLAEHYGKDPKQIYRWLKRHDLDPNDYR